jgi:hypothetical protein
LASSSSAAAGAGTPTLDSVASTTSTSTLHRSPLSPVRATLAGDPSSVKISGETTWRSPFASVVVTRIRTRNWRGSTSALAICSLISSMYSE